MRDEFKAPIHNRPSIQFDVNVRQRHLKMLCKCMHHFHCILICGFCAEIRFCGTVFFCNLFWLFNNISLSSCASHWKTLELIERCKYCCSGFFACGIFALGKWVAAATHRNVMVIFSAKVATTTQYGMLINSYLMSIHHIVMHLLLFIYTQFIQNVRATNRPTTSAAVWCRTVYFDAYRSRTVRCGWMANCLVVWRFFRGR